MDYTVRLGHKMIFGDYGSCLGLSLCGLSQAWECPHQWVCMTPRSTLAKPASSLAGSLLEWQLLPAATAPAPWLPPCGQLLRAMLRCWPRASSCCLLLMIPAPCWLPIVAATCRRGSPSLPTGAGRGHQRCCWSRPGWGWPLGLLALPV